MLICRSRQIRGGALQWQLATPTNQSELMDAGRYSYLVSSAAAAAGC
jgi:hypothetical protein